MEPSAPAAQGGGGNLIFSSSGVPGLARWTGRLTATSLHEREASGCDGVGVIYQGLKVCRAAAGARIQRATEERRTFFFVFFPPFICSHTLLLRRCVTIQIYFFLFIRVIQTGPMIIIKTKNREKKNYH